MKTRGLILGIAAGLLFANSPGMAGSTCTSNAQCPPDSYCDKADGDCQGLGQCRKRPEICFDIYDPVCGCDGRTYGNACYAARARVNVKYRGECFTPSPCTSNAQCPSGSYCAKVLGDCDGQGNCQQKPTGCPDMYDPVCGCDSKTYDNECYAAAAGVNVKYRGRCSPREIPGPVLSVALFRKRPMPLESLLCQSRRRL